MVAKGQRLMAARIRDLAMEHNIPIVEDIPIDVSPRQILRHQIFAWKMQKGSAAGGRRGRQRDTGRRAVG